MNTDDYAQYIVQKHMVAIALAVIKTKPANTTYEAYIGDLRKKIKEKNMDANLDITICDDDFNISDDFINDDGDQTMMTHDDEKLNKSHDSVTILKNFDLNNLSDPFKVTDDANSLLDVMTELDNIEQNNFTQSTNFDESQIPAVNILTCELNETADNNRTFCETNIESNCKVGNDFKTAINIEKHYVIHSNINNYDKNIKKDFSKITYCESDNLTEINRQNDSTINLVDTINTNKINIENNNVDTQQTILYTLQGFTSNTHVSQSQENVFVAKENLLSRSKFALDNNTYNQNTKRNTQNSKNELEVAKENNITKNIYRENDIEIFYASNNEKIVDVNAFDGARQDFDNLDVNKGYMHDITIFSNKEGKTKHKNVQNDYIRETKRIKTDVNEKINTSTSLKNSSYIPKYQNNDTITRTLVEDFENVALFRPNNENDNLTQEFTFLDNSNYLTPISQDGQNLSKDTFNFETKRTQQSSEFRFSPEESQSLLLTTDNCGSEYLNSSIDFHGTNVNDKEIESEKIKPTTNRNSNLTTKYIYGNKCKHVQNINPDAYYMYNSITSDDPVINLSQTVKNISSLKNKELGSIDLSINTNNEMKVRPTLEENEKENDETKKVICHQSKTKECISNENTQMDVLTENYFCLNEQNSQLEIVSFKTLEDLNTIKCYLNRRDRRFSDVTNSLDSGFRSSQPKSSYKSASQYSELRINESANGLLTFLTVSQFSDKTAEIVDETSKIIGKLVDKLHEEEKYPNFLEELLDKVNVLLKELYDGNNEEFNTLLKRDDAISRLLLLNRSKHINNYTIEKIIIILEKTYSDLTEDVFELEDIDKSENICYIFQVLEVLLKRVKKPNQQSQMSVQDSQDDDRVLKKSSLTEIWRRKWNLAKSDISEGSAKKKCVLTKCSEILNKIIVQAMDGYSLVSYAALQCFNLLQN